MREGSANQKISHVEPFHMLNRNSIANAVCEDGEARVHECRKIIKIRVVEYVN